MHAAYSKQQTAWLGLNHTVPGSLQQSAVVQGMGLLAVVQGMGLAGDAEHGAASSGAEHGAASSGAEHGAGWGCRAWGC